MNKALLVGINYTNSANALHGCLNDVENVLSYLRDRFQVVNVINLATVGGKDVEDDETVSPSGSCCLPRCTKKSPGNAVAGQGVTARDGIRLDNLDMERSTLDVVVLTDSQTGLHYPTKSHILSAFHWLTEGATAESRLFFHYSGHGSHQRDRNGDEPDGQDESLVPVDFRRAGCIIDDEVRQHLVDPLPEGCHLRMILDCCHSASGADLRYCYRDQDAKQGSRVPVGNPRVSDTKCHVVSWSGCLDAQTSADAWIDGKAAGALTATFLKILRSLDAVETTSDEPRSYHTIYVRLLEELKKGGYTQRAQLSSGQPIDVSGPFDLF